MSFVALFFPLLSCIWVCLFGGLFPVTVTLWRVSGTVCYGTQKYTVYGFGSPVCRPSSPDSSGPNPLWERRPSFNSPLNPPPSPDATLGVAAPGILGEALTSCGFAHTPTAAPSTRRKDTSSQAHGRSLFVMGCSHARPGPGTAGIPPTRRGGTSQLPAALATTAGSARDPQQGWG